MKKSHIAAVRVAIAFFASLFILQGFAQTPPSAWDTLPWKSYADFKLQLLNKSYITTGVLYDRMLPIAQVDEHSGLPSTNTDTVTSDLTLQAYYEMYNSAYNTSTWTQPDSLDKMIRTIGSQNQHPIGVFLYNYNILDSNALQNHLLDTAANGQFRDVAGRSRSPYFTYTSFFASPLAAEDQVITTGQHEFYLDSRFFIHNQTATVQQIRIDFGDGQGEWVINNPYSGTKSLSAENLSINGFASSIIKNITGTIFGRITVVIVDVLGHTIQYGNPFKIFVKSTKQYAPLTTCKGLQKWVINADPTALAQVNTQYGNPQLDYKGRKDTAYFYFAGNGSSCSQTVRRPIVFIDGFDPTNTRGVQQIYQDYINVTVTRNGNPNISFGDYMLSQGYDFIILDFKHGNDLLERNALTLVALLQRLNQTYGSSYLQDITLIGPSMGSLIAQYALAYMEHNNIPHRVKTYVSFDGCHQGANVPIGLQSFVEYLTKRGVLSHIKLIREGLYNGLAARQMLAHHVSTKSALPAPDPLRTKFLNNLAALGTYPTLCRKVALINGANNGILNPDQGSNADLLRIYVKRRGFKSLWGLCGDNICKIFDWTARTAPSSGTQRVASMWTLSPLFNILFWVPPGNTNYYGTATWNNSALDNAPGGRFGTIFGTEPGSILESNFQFLLKEGLYLLTGSKRSFFSQNLNNFTMMPSYSSADLNFSTKDLYMNWGSQYLCGKTPFDYVYAPTMNEQHVFVSQQGSQWFENEVRCTVSSLPTYVTPQITQVTGTNPLCTTGTFQISTCKPVNAANIVWTSSNTNVATVVGNGTSATVTKKGSGSATITATVNFCNGYSVAATKTINAGGPIVNISYYQVGSCNNGYQTWWLDASSPNTVTSWRWTVDNPNSGSWYIYAPSSSGTHVDVMGGGGISITATNSCGATRNGVTIYSACSNFAFETSPNPTEGELTVTTDDESTSTTKATGRTSVIQNKIYKIKLTDQSGNIKRVFSFSGVKTAKLNISSLHKGVYIISVYNGKEWSSKKIILQK